MRFRFYNILLLIFISIACPARAADPSISLDFKGVYEFGMPGLPIGKMGIEAQQNAKSYSVTSDIILSSLVKLFVQHTSHTSVDATGQDFKYSDEVYETHYQTKKKKKYVKLVYKAGKMVEQTLEPPDPKRPKVPAELSNQAADPLSFILRMREQIAAAQAQKKDHFNINVFDGRRLYETNLTIDKDTHNIVYKNQKTPVILVSVQRKLLSGFTPSELADADPHEPPLYIYFSKDARLIPLRLEVNTWFGLLYAQLAKECHTGESCLFGLKE